MMCSIPIIKGKPARLSACRVAYLFFGRFSRCGCAAGNSSEKERGGGHGRASGKIIGLTATDVTQGIRTSIQPIHNFHSSNRVPFSLPEKGIGLQLPLLCMVRGTAFPALAFSYGSVCLPLRFSSLTQEDTRGHEMTPVSVPTACLPIFALEIKNP
mgnify:FL=1